MSFHTTKTRLEKYRKIAQYFPKLTPPFGGIILIFPHCNVSPQIKIGKNSIIASNSFLKNNVGDFELWGGVPARLIKKLDK